MDKAPHDLLLNWALYCYPNNGVKRLMRLEAKKGSCRTDSVPRNNTSRGGDSVRLCIFTFPFRGREGKVGHPFWSVEWRR